MATEDLVAAILARAKGRFSCQTEGSDIDRILALAPEGLGELDVIRLRRNNENAGWRTLLVVSLGCEQQLPLAYGWGANTRDRLQGAETADLYMIMSITNISDSDGAGIEANEQFCRKYVFRGDEDIDKLLDRTFLGPIIVRVVGEALVDPFIAALVQTTNRHSWLEDDQRECWHKTLLSGKSGSDLFEILLSTAPAGGNTR